MDITFQLNVIAISVAFLALAVLTTIIALFFVSLSFYYKYNKRLDELLKRIENIAEKAEEITDISLEESRRINHSLNFIHETINSVLGAAKGVTTAITDFSSSIFRFNITDIISAVINIFTSDRKILDDDDDDF